MGDILDQLQRRRDIWDTLDAPGQVLRNLLRGDAGAAARHGVDFLGDLGNAAIPFVDPIPSTTERGDFVDASELIGLDEDTPWWIKTPVNVVGGVLTDPLSAVSFGAPAAGKALLKEGAKAAALGRASAKASGLTGQTADAVVQASREQALPLSLEKHLSPKGRKALAQDKDLIAKMNDDPGNFEAASENVIGSDLFNQGGVRLSVPFTDIGTPYAFQGRDIDPLAALGAAGGAALNAMGETGESIRAGLADVRSTVGMRDLSPQERAILDKSQGTGQTYGATAQAHLDQLLGKLTPDQDRLVTMAMQNLKIDQGRPTGLLSAAGSDVETRIAAITAGLPKPDADAVGTAVRELSKWGDTQLGLERKMGILESGPATNGPYLQRLYTGVHDADQNFLKERSLTTEQSVMDYMAANPKARMEESARVAAQRRAESGSRAATRASLVREAVDPTAVLADKATHSKIEAAMEELAKESPDFARALEVGTQGMPPRNAINKALSYLNTSMPFAFKKAAVSGVVIPRIASLVRNQLGGILQVGSQFGAPGALFEAGQAIPNIAKAISDGSKASWGKAFGTLDEQTLSKDMQALEHAFKAGAGDPQQAIKILAQSDTHAAEALQMGVLDNLVSAEQMLTKAAASGAFKRGASALWDWPAEMFKYLEQNMRMGLYKKLRSENFSPELAAQAVKDSFLDYSVTSAGNRTLRDWIPFAAFITQTIPQQARNLSRSGGAAVAASQLFTSEGDAPIYPYMENQLHIPSGQDQQGRDQYITGTGAPVETLNLIPGSLDETRQNIIGQSNPLLKTALGAVFGIDPYFGTPFGSYDKAPGILQALGADERGTVGSAYNLAKGAGIVQPFANVATLWDTMTSDTITPAEKAMRTLTGVREVAVDEDMALRQQLERLLEGRSDIDTTETIYSRTRDPESLELLRELRALKERQKAARLAQQAALAPQGP